MPRVDGGLELVSCRRGARRAPAARGARSSRANSACACAASSARAAAGRSLGGTLDSGAQLAVASAARPPAARAPIAGTPSTPRGASGKEVRQLFERQGALVSRVLRTQLGPVHARALARARSVPRAHARRSSRRCCRARAAACRLSIEGACPLTPRLAGPSSARYGAGEGLRQRQRLEILGRVGLAAHRGARAPGVERVDAHAADALELRGQHLRRGPRARTSTPRRRPSRRARGGRRCWR